MCKWSLDFKSMGGLWLVNQGVYIESCILSTPQWARLRTRRISFKLCWWPQIKTEPLYTSHNAEQIAMPLRNFHSYPPQSPNVYYKAGIHRLFRPIFSKSFWSLKHGPVRSENLKIFLIRVRFQISRFSGLGLDRPALVRGSLLRSDLSWPDNQPVLTLNLVHRWFQLFCSWFFLFDNISQNIDFFILK